MVNKRDDNIHTAAKGLLVSADMAKNILRKQAEYIDEKKKSWEMWSKYLSKIEGKKKEH